MSRRPVLALALLLTGVLAAQSPGSVPAPQLLSISQDDLRADLFFLASDSLQGRLTNSLGNQVAAEWIKHRFFRLGLTPVGGRPGTAGAAAAPASETNGFEHAFQLATTELGTSNTARVVESSAVQADLKLRQDFYPQRISANAEVTGAVVFVGFGIVSPERQHDDYGTAVNGKIALALDREPGVRDANSRFDGLVSSEAGQPLRKALAAQAKGAIGLLLVQDLHNADPAMRPNFEAQANGQWPAQAGRIPRFTLMKFAEQVRIPVVQISIAVGERLVRGTGKSLLEIAKLAERKGGAEPLPLAGVELRLQTDLVRHTVPSRNVIAMLQGADPRLKDEYVLIGAHFDHDGTDGQRIWNGADDDGSGTVGMLETAEAFALGAQADQRPKRSVIFAAWNAEEQGLLGSWAFTEFPSVPLDRLVAVINLDMIGRNEEVPEGGGARFGGLESQLGESNANHVNVVGLSRSADLRTAVGRANAQTGLILKASLDNHALNLIRRSDNWPFLHHGIPTVFFTTGLHPDYHTPEDRPEKINYVKMEKIVRLVYQLAWDLANQTTRPRLAAGPTSASAQ